jgi:integrase
MDRRLGDGMKRPAPKVTIRTMQVRKDGRANPFVVRWGVEGAGRPFEEAFPTKDQALDFEARIRIASRDGVRFSPRTGQPLAWGTTEARDVAGWARAWFQEQWDTAAPRTRVSYSESLVRLIEAIAPDNAKPLDGQQRIQILNWLRDPGYSLPKGLATWVERNGLDLGELDRVALKRVDRRLRLKLDGTAASTAYGRRHVKVAKLCLRSAVEDGLIDVLPWPEALTGSKRKKVRKETAPGVRSTISPSEFQRLLEAIPSHQPASWMYRCFVAVLGYGGCRPSEAVLLEVEDFYLPETGWGTLSVTKALTGVGAEWDDGAEAEGDVKSFERAFPIPQSLVAEVRRWLDRSGITTGRLFVTRCDETPKGPNINRALTRACASLGLDRMTCYGFRHMAASHMVQAGVPLAETAWRMGHSVETLLRYYTERVRSQETIANGLLDSFYGGAQ